MQKTIYTFLFFVFTLNLSAQESVDKDTLTVQIPLKCYGRERFDYKTLIVPTVFVGYGIVSLQSKGLRNFDYKIHKRFDINRNKIKLDDYLQYTPTIAVYGLNAMGIQGKHDFCDRTIILGAAGTIMSSVVLSTKYLTGRERPDGSSKTSFPSVHTATAFMGAEFLYQEYKNVSVWYGILGYLVATGTGFLRMYNQRHWFSDVVTGAGVGILSTKLAYWMHPFIKQTFFRNTNNTGTILPYYDGRAYGLSLSMTF